MKFKCKECHIKQHVSCMENALNEISCHRTTCPLSPNVRHAPRENSALSFADFPKDEFTILEHYETPTPTQLEVQSWTPEEWAAHLNGKPANDEEDPTLFIGGW